MTVSPSDTYMRCQGLFRALQAVTGGDRGAQRSPHGEAYARDIMIYSPEHPDQGQSVMREVRIPGIHDSGNSSCYTLSKAPGMKGFIDIPVTGDPVPHCGAKTEDIQTFFTFWTAYIAAQMALLKQCGLL